MNYVVYITVMCVLVFLDAVSLAMLLRAIMSLFFMGESSKFGNFLFIVTEPMILPIRALCDRFGWFRGSPLDIPFFLTALSLSVLSMVVQSCL